MGQTWACQRDVCATTRSAYWCYDEGWGMAVARGSSDAKRRMPGTSFNQHSTSSSAPSCALRKQVVTLVATAAPPSARVVSCRIYFMQTRLVQIPMSGLSSRPFLLSRSNADSQLKVIWSIHSSNRLSEFRSGLCHLEHRSRRRGESLSQSCPHVWQEQRRW